MSCFYSLVHAYLTANTPCLGCRYINNPHTGPSNIVSAVSDFIPLSITTLLTLLASAQAAAAATQAFEIPTQYTSVAPGTIKQVRQTIGKGNTYKASTPAKEATSEGSNPVSKFIKFAIRVAHARYILSQNPSISPATT
jgi:hypothetical protein